jgi:hypothetical protein
MINFPYKDYLSYHISIITAFSFKEFDNIIFLNIYKYQINSLLESFFKDFKIVF